MCWVFIAARGLSLVGVSGGLLVVVCMGFSRGARAVSAGASVGKADGLSCFSACGIFLHQWSDLCSLHGQVVSCLLCYHGSPRCCRRNPWASRFPLLSFGFRFSCPRMLLGLSPSSLHQGGCVDALISKAACDLLVLESSVPSWIL